MFLTRTRITPIMLLAAGLAARAGLAGQPTGSAQESKEAIAFSGRVLDPDGKPVAGAKLHVLFNSSPALPAPAGATSDAEGRFRFLVPQAAFDRSNTRAPWEQATVVAVAAGYGLGVPESGEGNARRTDVTIRLVKDVPMTGRILDPQGKPVAGVTVHVQGLYAPKGGDLTALLKGFKEEQELFAPLRDNRAVWIRRNLAPLFAPVATGADGRFTIRGIGGNRLADLRTEGPAVATQEFYAMTRPGETLQLPNFRRLLPRTDLHTVYGNDFRHVAAPCKPIVGIVRDKDTGKPIAGAVVTSYRRAGSYSSAVTDLQGVADKGGRYRLLGMPKGEGNVIRAGPPEDEPYLNATREVADTTGLEPVAVDITLKRGVWVTGRVLDKVTRQPVLASVRYFVFEDNPSREEAPGLFVDPFRLSRAEDGSFRRVVLPGRGVLAADAVNESYRRAVGADAIKELGPDGSAPAYPRRLIARNFHTLAEVNPAPDAREVTCDLLLDPGRIVKGEVVGPDGKPLAGARVSGLRTIVGYPRWEAEPLKTAAFTVSGLAPGESRLVALVHDGKKLAGTLVLGADEKGPVKVKLAASATLIGRLVTPDGQPVTGGELSSFRRPVGGPPRREGSLTLGTFPDRLRPDNQGKVRIEGLVPGLTYYLGFDKGNTLYRLEGAAGDGLKLEPGETKDLGDIVVKPVE